MNKYVLIFVLVQLAFCLQKIKSQSDSIPIFKKSNHFYLHIGKSLWSPLQYQALNNIDIEVLNPSVYDIGIHFERSFHKKYYFALAANLLSYPTDVSIQFDRNLFGQVFNENNSGEISNVYIGYSQYQNYSYAFSGSLGKNWIDNSNWLLKTALGLNLAQFIINTYVKDIQVEFTSTDETNVIIFNENQPTGHRPFNLNYALLLNAELINQKHKFQYGIGVVYNLGLRPLSETNNAIIFLPNTEYYQVSRSIGRFNYFGIRLFAGI